MHYSKAFVNEALLRYEATLDSIEEERREPTPWEGKCLLSALYSMACDSWLLVQQNISRAGSSVGSESTADEVTIAGLRFALAEVRTFKSP